MPDSYGPRTYLIGRIISALIISGRYKEDEVSEAAVRIADETLDRMQLPYKKTP